MLDKQCISLQYNRITTHLKAQIESIGCKYNFYLAQVAAEYQVVPSSSKAPNDPGQSLGRSFTTVSAEIQAVPLMLVFGSWESLLPK